MSDPINHPAHYTQGTIEVIDAIEGLGLPYHESTILRYLARWRHKGGVEDLQKARWYLNRLIERAEQSTAPPATGSSGNSPNTLKFGTAVTADSLDRCDACGCSFERSVGHVCGGTTA